MPPARGFSMIKIVIVAVALLAPGCSSDHPVPDNDVPAIASLDPGYAVEGDATFNLFVHGQGFTMNSVVRWNGSDRVTILTNQSGEILLRASIPATDVASQTTAQITAFNPAPGGGTSNTVNFVVYDPSAINPVPTTTTVSPSTVTHNQDVTITVNGTGFVSGSTVTWKPAATTNPYTETNITIVNSTQLTVAIPAAHVTPSGAATLKVVNPPPGGGTSGGEIVNIL